MDYNCSECGTVFDDSLVSCPNCGCPKTNHTSIDYGFYPNAKIKILKEGNDCQDIQYIVYKRDWAHYIYECGVIFLNTYTQRYAQFSGRASRREYWSFTILFWFSLLLLAPLPWTPLLYLYPLFLIASIIPALGVGIRRMHDVNRSGWWILCPIAWFFLYLKASDKGENDYGEPMEYNEIQS